MLIFASEIARVSLSVFVPPHQKVIAVSPALASKRTMIDGMIRNISSKASPEVSQRSWGYGGAYRRLRIICAKSTPLKRRIAISKDTMYMLCASNMKGDHVRHMPSHASAIILQQISIPHTLLLGPIHRICIVCLRRRIKRIKRFCPLKRWLATIRYY